MQFGSHIIYRQKISFYGNVEPSPHSGTLVILKMLYRKKIMVRIEVSKTIPAVLCSLQTDALLSITAEKLPYISYHK